jgi:uncharacterized protein (TIGR02001 family)
VVIVVVLNNTLKNVMEIQIKKILLATAVTSAMLLPSLASADVSATVAIFSDYTASGVTQNDDSPALQLSLDYAGDKFYAGTWASNIDSGDDADTEIEWDFYLGKYFQLSQAFSIDAGIAYYTYHGQDSVDEKEIYANAGFASDLGQTELNIGYTWDLDGGDTVAMLAHSYEVVEGHSLRLSIEQSILDNDDKWSWYGESSYIHYRLGYETSVKGFDLSLAVETIDVNEDTNNTAAARIVAGVSHTYAF